MSCGYSGEKAHENGTKKRNGTSESKIEGKIYKDYLKLDGILSNVDMMSARHGSGVHDEHLFISRLPPLFLLLILNETNLRKMEKLCDQNFSPFMLFELW